MTAWLPVLKTVLPYLTTIVSAAVPAFNAKKDDEQIVELQEATRQNAESIRLLAEQMQRTIQALEAGANTADRTLKQTWVIAVASLITAVVSLIVALTALWAR